MPKLALNLISIYFSNSDIGSSGTNDRFCFYASIYSKVSFLFYQIWPPSLRIPATLYVIKSNHISVKYAASDLVKLKCSGLGPLAD